MKNFLIQTMTNLLAERLVFLNNKPERCQLMGILLPALQEKMLEHYPNAEFLDPTADAADHSLDLLIINGLCWSDVESMKNSLAIFHRLLKPEGVLLLLTFGPDTLMEIGDCGFLDMHHVGDALLGEGFINPVVDREAMKIIYEDLADRDNDLSLLGVSTENLSSELSQLTYEWVVGFAKASGEKKGYTMNAKGEACVPVWAIKK